MKDVPSVVSQQPIEKGQAHISDYDNLWNQIAVELARAHLQIVPNPPVDMKKVKRLQQELREVSKRDKIGWWA